MALQDYGKLGCFYNGSLLQQITSIHLVTDAGLIPVDILNEGLGGFTPGSGKVTLAIGFVVPVGGTEETFQEDCANQKFVTIQVPIGSKAYIGNGKLLNVEIGQTTNASVEGTFNWMGEISPLQ